MTLQEIAQNIRELLNQAEKGEIAFKTRMPAFIKSTITSIEQTKTQGELQLILIELKDRLEKINLDGINYTDFIKALSDALSITKKELEEEKLLKNALYNTLKRIPS